MRLLGNLVYTEATAEMREQLATRNDVHNQTIRVPLRVCSSSGNFQPSLLVNFITTQMLYPGNYAQFFASFASELISVTEFLPSIQNGSRPISLEVINDIGLFLNLDETEESNSLLRGPVNMSLALKQALDCSTCSTQSGPIYCSSEDGNKVM
ncbi:unnamed protein product [Ceutorhynchus assimilis]|uniref:Uncharacterized protein n=1 Tax=Ceutorhynchus assimilis TaxID=467358 RepID=A0A9N9M8Q1_9CUCU|nr:unnamed protein product [Ceutorhynchus assimilis]